MKQLLFLFFLGVGQFIYAMPLIGGYLTYEHISGSKYKLIAKLYRDCRGSAVTTNSVTGYTFAGVNSTSVCGPASLSFARTAINKIPTNCLNSTGSCNIVNDKNTNYGIEEHIYECDIDISKAPFTTFTGTNCCEYFFVISYSFMCSSMTTCIRDFKCMMNICNLKKCNYKINNSVKFMHNFNYIKALNGYQYMSIGGHDSIDFDSLSYDLIPNQTNYKKPTTTSYKIFITPVCSSPGVINCTPNPSSKPPKGLFFNQNSGDLVFCPTTNAENSVFAIQAKEFRMDTNSIWQHIGYSNIESDIYIENYSSYNYNPNIEGATLNQTCVGSSSYLNYTIKDNLFSPYQTIDTVNFDCKFPYRNVSFSITENSNLEKKITLKIKLDSSKNYKNNIPIVIGAVDYNCNIPGKSFKTFFIKPYYPSKATYTISKYKCNQFILNATPASTNKNSTFFKWRVLDSSNNVIYTGNKKTDTTISFSYGKYYLKLYAYSTDSCGTYYWDSFTTRKTPTLNLQKDTYVCTNNKVTINISNVNHAIKPISYWWYSKHLILQSDSIPYLQLKKIEKDSTIFVKLVDSNTCSAIDTIIIKALPLPAFYLQKKFVICYNDFAPISAPVEKKYTYLWNNKYVTQSIKVNKSGNYKCTVTDSNNCEYTDSTVVAVNDTLQSAFPKDTAACDGAVIMLESAIINNYVNNIAWKNLQNNSTTNLKNLKVQVKNTVPNSPSQINLFVLNATAIQNGIACYLRDTIKILAKSKPFLQWTNSDLGVYCWNKNIAIDLKSKTQYKASSIYYQSLKNIPIINNQYLLKNTKNLVEKINVIDTIRAIAISENYCKDSFNTKIEILPAPQFVVKDTGFCAIDSIYFLNNNVSRKADSVEKIEVISSPNVDNLIGYLNGNYYLRTGDIHDFKYNGIFKLAYTEINTKNQCKNSDTFTIEIAKQCKYSFANNNSFCSGSQINLAEIVTLDNTLLKDSLHFINVVSNKMLAPNDSVKNKVFYRTDSVGSFKFNMLLRNKFCLQKDTLNIFIRPSPKALFELADSTDFDNYLLTPNNKSFINNGEKLNYIWTYRNQKFYEKNPVIGILAIPGKNTIQLIVNSDSACSDTFEKTITMFEPLPVDYKNLGNFKIIPNPVTANNGVIRIKINNRILPFRKAYITNAVGKRIKTDFINNELIMNSVPEGVYYLVVGSLRYKLLIL